MISIRIRRHSGIGIIGNNIDIGDKVGIDIGLRVRSNHHHTLIANTNATIRRLILRLEHDAPQDIAVEQV